MPEKNAWSWQMKPNSQVLFSVMLLVMLSIFCVARFFSLQDQARFGLAFAVSTILPLVYIFLNRFKLRMPTVLLKFSFLWITACILFLSIRVGYDIVISINILLSFFLSIFVINLICSGISRRRLILVIDAYGMTVALFCAVFSLSGFPYSHDYPGIFLSGSILGGCSALFFTYFFFRCLGVFSDGVRTDNAWNFFLLAFIFLALVVMSEHRTGMLFVLLFLTYFFCVRVRSKTVRLLTIVSVGAGVLTIFPMVSSYVLENLFFESQFSGIASINSSGRFNAWEILLSALLRDSTSLMFGLGGSSIEQLLVSANSGVRGVFQVPHNEYLRLAVTGGFPLVLAAVFFISCFGSVRGVDGKVALFQLSIYALLALEAFLSNILFWTFAFVVPWAMMSALTEKYRGSVSV